MATSSSSGCSGVLGDYLHNLLPPSPIATHEPEFDWEGLAEDVVLHSSGDVPSMTADGCQSILASQHPLSLDSNADSVDDLFDALDLLLESEFPMEAALSASPDTDCSCWTDTMQLESPGASRATDLARSCSCTGTEAANCTYVTPGSAITAGPAVRSISAGTARSAPTAVASPDAQSAGAIAAAVSAVRAATSPCSMQEAKPMPRWKLYHLQQKQELLAPKQPAISPASSDTEGSCQVGLSAAAAPLALAALNGSTSPVSVAATPGMQVPACNTGSVTSSFTGGATISPVTTPSTAAAMGNEHMLLLNVWQQQQQVQLLQQQQTASAVTGKRPLALADYSLPKMKRSRTSAAGNVAAQHLYGLTAEPSQQLQQLQSLQVQLHAQLQQSYQQQVEQYQQQQIQALHHQLHMRLQVQQHQQALQMQVHSWGGRQAHV